MSDERFDAFLMALARARTRRAMLAAVAASTTAATALSDTVWAGRATIEACESKGERCQEKTDCCSKRCRKRKNAKKGRCRCSREGQRCNDPLDCCVGPEDLFCAEDSRRCEVPAND
jgi:hypothetical protein